MIAFTLIVGFIVGYILGLLIYYEPSKIRNYYLPCSFQKHRCSKESCPKLGKPNDWIISSDEEVRRQQLFDCLKRQGLLNPLGNENKYTIYGDNKTKFY